jgi:hypothetical protein
MTSNGISLGSHEMLASPQMTFIRILALWIAMTTHVSARRPFGPGPAQLGHSLEIVGTGFSAPQHLDLDQALQTLETPSVSVALIDRSEVAWARVYGAGGVSTRTL